MTDPDWGNPEPTIPDPPTPADDEDFAERMAKLDEEAEDNDD